MKNVLPVLSGSWAKAFWKVAYGEYFHPDHDSRCRSTLLQMQAVIHAKAPLMNDHGARYCCLCSQHVFTLPDIAHLVMKGLSSISLCPSFSPTRRAKRFYSEAELPGLENLPRLICGLVPNHTWSEINGIYITSPRKEGSSINWVLDIYDAKEHIDNLQFELEFESKPKKPRFRPKDVPAERFSEIDSSA